MYINLFGISFLSFKIYLILLVFAVSLLFIPQESYAQPECGNGIIDGAEVCDDGNTMSGDGCSNDCFFIEPGFNCITPGEPCVPICGDGIVIPPEECDDGNDVEGDGCSDICTIEPGYFCDNEAGLSDCRLGCEITVVKDATPPYDTEFDFLRLTTSLFLPPPFYVFNEFTLTDPSSPQTTFSVPVLSLTFLAELPPDGWDLDNITCGPDEIVELTQEPVPPEFEDEFSGVLPGNLVVAVCILAGSATCTYENSADPNERFDLTVTEDARFVSPNFEINTSSNSAIEDTEFPFTVTAGALNDNFALNNQESETMEDMPISTIYTILQQTPEGWMLEDIQCEGTALFNTVFIESGVEVEVLSPGNLECTFFNTRPFPRNVPTLSQWGLIITVLLIGMAGVLAYRKRFHQSL